MEKWRQEQIEAIATQIQGQTSKLYGKEINLEELKESIAKGSGVKNCKCTDAGMAFFCPYGHLTECHYPHDCNTDFCHHYDNQE